MFDATCKCITADYTLNDDGTVGVVNQCQELGLPVSISGTATAADPAYGEVGVLDVSFFGTGSVCQGPNYIVQGQYSTAGTLVLDVADICSPRALIPGNTSC